MRGKLLSALARGRTAGRALGTRNSRVRLADPRRSPRLGRRMLRLLDTRGFFGIGLRRVPGEKETVFVGR